MALYRGVFRTKNHWTLLVDGTARAGIEACLASALAPGDRMLVPVFGRFGHLKMEIGRRLRRRGRRDRDRMGQGVRRPTRSKPRSGSIGPNWSRSVTATRPPPCCSRSPRSARSAASTTCCSMSIARPRSAATRSRWTNGRSTCASAGLQKCLSGPPGSAPVSFNDRAAAVITARKHIEQGIRTRRHRGRRRTDHPLELFRSRDADGILVARAGSTITPRRPRCCTRRANAPASCCRKGSSAASRATSLRAARCAPASRQWG